MAIIEDIETVEKDVVRRRIATAIFEIKIRLRVAIRGEINVGLRTIDDVSTILMPLKLRNEDRAPALPC